MSLKVIKINGLPYGYPPDIPQEVLDKVHPICGDLPYEVCNAKLIALDLVHGQTYVDLVSGIYCVGKGTVTATMHFGHWYLHEISRRTAEWWATVPSEMIVH